MKLNLYQLFQLKSKFGFYFSKFYFFYLSNSKSTSTATTMSNGEIKLLLFVNDLKSHLIHCCTYEQYLIPIQVNAFGICALNNGNLALIASKDIRGLNVQDYLKNNNV